MMWESLSQKLSFLGIGVKKEVPIQNLWIGNKLSLFAELGIKSYLKNGFEYHLYTYEAMSNLPEGAIAKDANEIVPKDLIFTYSNGSYAAFSNLFRYSLLYQKGGIWSDTDIVCLKHFKFDQDYVFASEAHTDYQQTFTTPFFLQSKPQTEPFKFAVDECMRLREKVISGEIEWGIGSMVLTAMIEKFNLKKYAVPWQTFTTCNCHHIQSFLDPNYNEFPIPKKMSEIPEQTVAVHLWNEIFRRQNIDVNQKFPDGSMIEEFKTKYL